VNLIIILFILKGNINKTYWDLMVYAIIIIIIANPQPVASIHIGHAYTNILLAKSIIHFLQMLYLLLDKIIHH